MTDPIVDELSGFAAALDFDDLPASTVRAAELRVYDSFAVGLLALREDPVRRLVDHAVAKCGAGEAPILGTEHTSSSEYAAFANAAAIRYLDWNDTYLAAEAAHPSCNLGAVLAAGAANESSGRDLLLATVLAYEVQCRLCDLAAFTERGFDHVNWGLVSVPLAVGKLMGLSEDALGEAVSIALAGHLGTLQARQPPITEWKGFAFGNAARNGVAAAEMARDGVRGPSAIFAGEHGVGTVVDGRLDAADLDLGEGFLIEETHLKRYPVCHHALAGIDAVVEITEEAALDLDDVAAIDVATYEIAIRTTAGEGKWRPTTRGTADHSLPYCLARAFLDGTVGPDDLEGDRLAEPDVLALMDAVSVHHEEAYTERYGDTFTHEVTITTDDWEYERRVDYPLGHFQNSLAPEEVAGKVLDHSAVAPDAVDYLRSAVEDLDGASATGALFEAATAVGEQLQVDSQP